METKKNLRFLLNEFKQSKDYYYFNYANLAKTPKSVTREISKTQKLFCYGSKSTKKMEKYYDDVRSHLTATFGGKKSNWYFLGPVSSVISNVLMHIIRDFLKKKNKRPLITTYKMNFPSLILPAKSISELGLCDFNLIEYPIEGIDNKWLEKNIVSDIFMISLVDFFNGKIHDLNLIHKFCQSKEILLIVDFSQFPFWGILNVTNFPNTIFISVLHKWLLGFPGHSIAYIDLNTEPFINSWQNMKDLFNYDTEKLNKSYEISNRSFLPFSSFEGAFKLCEKIGFDKINKYMKTSVDYLLDMIMELKNKYPVISVTNNIQKFNDKNSTIVSFTIGEKTDELSKFLMKNNIILSYFKNKLIRISTSFITSKEEIEFLIKKIEEWFKENYQ